MLTPSERPRKTKLELFFFNNRENCLYNDDNHDFSIWLRTGSNPADIDRFRSRTENFVEKLTNLSWVGGFGEGSALEPKAESLLGMVHITVDLDSIFPKKNSV